jgi:23S rRNA pseudouridine1911/1915/1917 synthase
MPAFAHLPTAAGSARTPAKFRIVAETDDYLVVEKPALLLIHPTKPDGTPTLWAGLRELLAFELVNGGQFRS